MVKVNEYFDGNVKSLSLLGAGGQETVGVMQAGEYTFNTALKEIVTVISGAMTVQLPGEEEWILIQPGESFEVPANDFFNLKIYRDTAYLCQFVG
jgi:purine/pyrimidine-nucleoside phosphorylase